MKRNFLLSFLVSVLLICVSACCLFACSCNDEEANNVEQASNGLQFVLSEDGSSYSFVGLGSYQDKSVVIPSTFNNKPVTNIAWYAFYECSFIEDVVISEGITQIGVGAFKECDKLKNIDIPSSVTLIEYDAFWGCDALKEIEIPDSVADIREYSFTYCSIEKATVPANAVSHITNNQLKEISVTSGSSISAYAFKDCELLTDVTLAESITYIGEGAFENCSSLGTLDIPDAVSSIGANTFKGCSSLTSVEIPAGVTQIGISAFNGCSSLLDIELPSGITAIENYTFTGCESLVELDIPNNVSRIGEAAFSNCRKLEAIEIPDGVSSIQSHTFASCESLENVVIPQSVALIGDNVFDGCKKLPGVVLPEGIPTIGNMTFRNCLALSEIVIPNSVKSVGVSAFEGCEVLAQIGVSENLESVGDQAFAKCSALKTISIPVKLTAFGVDVFSDCDLEQVKYGGNANQWVQISFATFKANPLYSAEKLYISDEVVTSIQLNEGSVIKDYVFYNFKGLENVSISNSFVKIGASAFFNCSGMADVNFVGSINEWVQIEFVNKDSNPVSYAKKLSINGEELSQVEFAGIQKISAYAFNNCESITNVTIPLTIVEVGEAAFNGTANLQDVNYLGTADDWVKINFTSFDANPVSQSEKLSVNGQVLEQVELHNSTAISNYAFYNCKTLKEIIVPTTLNAIGVSAFKNCEGLVKTNYLGSVNQWVKVNFATFDSNPITYSKGLHINNELVTTTYISEENISAFALYNCETLEEINVAYGVKNIGESAFHGCVGLQKTNYIGALDAWAQINFETESSNPIAYSENLYINDELLVDPIFSENITSISKNAFYKCKSIQSVVIPSEVNTVGANAFYGCQIELAKIPAFAMGSIKSNSLRGLEIIRGVVSGAEFSDCSNLQSVRFLKDVDSVSGAIFNNCPNLVEIKVDLANESFKSLDGNLYSKDGKTMLRYAPGKTQSSFVIPQEVESLGSGAFAGSLVSEITFSNSTTLEQISLSSLRNLTTVTLLGNVDSVDTAIFNGCVKLSNINVDTSNENYKSLDGNLYSKDGKTMLRYAPGKTQSSFVIPQTVEIIESNAFRGCSVELEEITLSTSISKLKNNAFNNAISLSKINFLGTKAQWAAIEKENGWKGSAPITTIVCSDGEITI